MKEIPLPDLKEIHSALTEASVDLFGFSVVCLGGVTWAAEKEVLDTLYVGLEKYWFTTIDGEKPSHKEFREEFFKNLWLRVKGKTINVQLGIDVPLGHEAMRFYKLGKLERALLYLRTKKQFSIKTLSFIFDLHVDEVRKNLEESRTLMLGRKVREVSVIEEDF
ncbi:MAG: hypothetical protein M9962_00085 [Oligoflexia bacterium]|nr:hypothetical protein [Oligoflexia bacterium]